MNSQSFASRWPCTLQRFSRVSDFELAEDAKELLCDNGLPRFFQINSARFEFVNAWVSLAEATDNQHGVLDREMRHVNKSNFSSDSSGERCNLCLSNPANSCGFFLNTILEIFDAPEGPDSFPEKIDVSCG